MFLYLSITVHPPSLGHLTYKPSCFYTFPSQSTPHPWGILLINHRVSIPFHHGPPPILEASYLYTIMFLYLSITVHPHPWGMLLINHHVSIPFHHGPPPHPWGILLINHHVSIPFHHGPPPILGASYL